MTGLAPYGTWVSPLSAADVAAGGRRLGGVSLDGDHIYWLEGRPDEGGRNALVRRGFVGEIADVTPSEINVRSRVNEYGGGAYLVTSGAVYCSNFADQRVYRIRDGVARLSPSGTFMVTVPAFASLWSSHDEYLLHFRR